MKTMTMMIMKMSMMMKINSQNEIIVFVYIHCKIISSIQDSIPIISYVSLLLSNSNCLFLGTMKLLKANGAPND